MQGLACSAIPPMVMGMLVVFFPSQRLRMMGAWAAANGVGQAVGPPIGGLVSDLFGWRSIFAIMSVASLVVLIGIARSVPRVEGRHSRLHLTGALMLSSGAACLLVALTALSVLTVPRWGIVVTAALGLFLLGGFLQVSRNNPKAMIPPHLIIEARFLRSSLAAFAQMFTLGTVLVVMPLYLTGPLGLSLSQAGVLFFVLPLAMAVMAPFVSRLSDRLTPRLVLRVGLAIIVVGTVASGALIRGEDDRGSAGPGVRSADPARGRHGDGADPGRGRSDPVPGGRAGRRARTFQHAPVLRVHGRYGLGGAGLPAGQPDADLHRVRRHRGTRTGADLPGA